VTPYPITWLRPTRTSGRRFFSASHFGTAVLGSLPLRAHSRLAESVDLCTAKRIQLLVTGTVLADPLAAGRRRPAGRLLLPMGPSTPLRLVHNLAVILLLVPLVFAPVASAGTNSSLVHLGLAISYAAAVSLVSLALFVHGSLSC
jgi:hypothetical protein